MNFDNLKNEYFSKIYSGNINQFNKFIQNNNLSINILNKNNENALHLIIKTDLSNILKINFIKYLISKNININEKDKDNNTPFNLACQKHLYEIITILYDKYKDKINLYEKNKFGFSPIFYIFKGKIVDEIDNYPNQKKFIVSEKKLEINDVSKIYKSVKEYIQNQKIFSDKCNFFISVIKKNINFELKFNEPKINDKYNVFLYKLLQNNNIFSNELKYEFYNEIFDIIISSHPKIFDSINFDPNFDALKTTKNIGFYYKDQRIDNMKIHGEITFKQNFPNVKNNNIIQMKNQDLRYNEIKSSLFPDNFFFPFLEEIAHIYYCREFLVNINKLYNSPNECRLQEGEFKSFNQLNDFIEYINSLGDGNKVIKIASGSYHNLVLTSKGEVYSFGSNNESQCGFDNNTDPIFIPTLINGTGVTKGNSYDFYNPKLGKIKDIACGKYHSLILNEDGTVFSFGRNLYGECGYFSNFDGPFKNGNKWRPYKIKDSNNFKNKNFISIACGAYHNLLLSENKTVFTFGYNQFGQLGKNINNNNHIPYEIQDFIIEKIACGYSHSIIIDINGVVRSFGDNRNGQLGTNRHIDLINEQVIQQGAFGIRTEGFETNRNIISIIKGTGSNNF